MDTAEAEKKLNDLLLNGIAKEIFAADQAKALAETIGKNSPVINDNGFGVLFGTLQNVLSDHQTLAVAKIYDPPSSRYPTRSIPATLSLLEEFHGLWSLPERFILEDLIISDGNNETAIVRDMSNQDLSTAVVARFNKGLPAVGKSNCVLSSALKIVRNARDKVHAHNEAVEKAVRKLPTWGEVELLVNYAKDFMCVIGRGYLGTHFGNNSDDYLLAWDARRVSKMMDKVIQRAVLERD
jgi:hypothetical protein